MPLFMMISGFVVNVERFKLASRVKLLIPFFFFGLLYTYLITEHDFVSFIEHEAKCGYWYLYAIVVFFFALWIIRQTKINLTLGIVLFGLFFIGLHALFHRTTIGTSLSTDHLWQMWLFFSFGIFLRRKGFDILKKHVSRNLVVCVIFTILLIIVPMYLPQNAMTSIGIGTIRCFFISAGFLLLFYALEQYFKPYQSKTKQCLKSIGNDVGKNTLQIYVLHYFFLSLIPMKFLGDWMLRENVVWLEYLISPVLSLVIAYFCIWTACLIYKLHLGFVFGR